MTQSVQRAIHCVNPNCPHPYPNIWGNKYCRSCGAPLQLRNRYVPLQQLGAGGFARIYTVWDLHSRSQRVLKVLTDTSPKALELFEQEAVVLANLRHPGVPKVEADGFFSVTLGDSQQSLPCLVMEKINGQTLHEVLEQHPQGCPEQWVLAWLQQAVDILQELHNRQIVHRDIKPSNLMLREATGQLVLIDFGGAKQIEATVSRVAASSTRLYTSGYSPPEQVVGAKVGPAADFYALGRTMIELLTGKYITEFQDPLSGELKWRHAAQVSPATADLLDEMVREDPRRRPANAKVIQERLARSHKSRWVSLFKLALNGWHSSRIVFRSLTVGLSNTTIFLVKALVQLIRACLDSAWEMFLGAGGACVGALIGFVLAYWSPLGAAVANSLSQQLAFLVPDVPIVVASDVVLFAFAGLGTAWGLTAAGGFGQRRRYLVAAFMGLFGYGLSSLIWQLLLRNTGDIGIAGCIAIAVAFLTLGLKLPTHHLVHASVAAIGCAVGFLALESLGYQLDPITLTADWQALIVAIALFATLGATLGLWLGISYYVVVPILRFLGW